MNFIKRALEVKRLHEEQLNDLLNNLGAGNMSPSEVTLLVCRNPFLQDRATQIDIICQYIEYLDEGPAVTRLGALDHFVHAFEAVVMPGGRVIRHVGVLQTLRFQLTSGDYTPPVSAMPESVEPKNVVVYIQGYDRDTPVYLIHNGKQISYASYDEHGSDAMEQVHTTAKRLAKSLRVDLHELNTCTLDFSTEAMELGLNPEEYK